MLRNWRKLWVLVSLILAVAIPVSAHSLGVARVELREQTFAGYTLEVNLPPSPEFLSGEPTLPSRCQLEQSPSAIQRPGILVRRFEFTCDGKPLKSGDSLHLPWKREGAFVLAAWLDGSGATRFFAPVPGQSQKGTDIAIADLKSETLSPLGVAKRYFSLGIEHILTGWDHLAFVLCLCLIARGWSLVKLVTGFTIGHSLSLALATLNLIRVPSPPVEACIALSIAFMAREALLPSTKRRHEVGLVCAFGLLHGLGFAGALKEVGINTAELLLGLLTFNLGVEFGQLIFVAAVVSLMVVGRKLPKHHLIRQVIAYGIGILGMYWTLERVGSFS